MTFRKRLRVLVSILTQEWSEKTCAECGDTWMAEGKARPELVSMCDRCEAQALERFMAHAERRYQEIMKGVEL
jgi:hypothetical protein